MTNRKGQHKNVLVEFTWAVKSSIYFYIYFFINISLPPSSLNRAWFQAGINFLAVRPSNLVAWEIKQEITTGSSSLAVLCQRKAYSTAER
jgi:hypothetical protein